MTWAKYGTEFFDQLVDMDFPDELTDACMLTHAQALHYLYSVEDMNMTFPKIALRRFATSTQADAAAHALVQAGAWIDHGRRFQVTHHADVFRQSLATQTLKKGRDKGAQQRKRDRESGSKGAPNVSADISADVVATQTDRQTALDNQPTTKADTSTGRPTAPPPPSSEDFSSSEVGPDGWPMNLSTRPDGGGTDGPSSEALSRWGRSA